MADYRLIKTRIWHDNWFLSLNKEEKLLWIFLLTNEFVHISGLYELPKTLVSPLVGALNFEEILIKFEKDGKILYKDGWILILNQIKHQSKQLNKKDNIFIAINNYFKENELILAKFGLKPEYPYKPLTSPLPLKTKALAKEEDLKEEDLKEEEIVSPNGDEIFSFKNKLSIMLDDKNKLIPIIAIYWLIKGIKFENEEQYKPALSRELKASSILKGYKLKQIQITILWLVKNAKFKWTLETVNKFIQEKEILKENEKYTTEECKNYIINLLKNYENK